MFSSLALSQLALLPALASAAEWSLREVGARNTLDWRMWLESAGKPVSFWHDVPIYPNGGGGDDQQVVHMVIEIPRWTDGKIEIKRDEPMNPIFHDDKDGEVRFVESVWPMKTYPFLYGSIPQTWENPNVDDDFTHLPGDNDPVDIFDIGQDPGYTGQIKQVKLLGALAMIDDDATDWKVMAIDVEDPLSGLVDSFEDLEKYRPGLIQSYYDWFVYYKAARGKGLNEIKGGEFQDAEYVVDFINKSHGYWNKLIKGVEDSNEINYNQTSQRQYADSYIKKGKTEKRFDIPHESNILPAVEKPEKYNWWYYLDEDFEPIEVPEEEKK